MRDIPFEHVISEHYTVFDGLAGMHVEDIYQDRQGFIWVATADGGVSRFDSARFDRFGLKNGLPNLTVMAIAEDADGRLLFGTFGGGLAAYDGCSFQVYTTEHGLPSNEIVGLQAQPDGSVLVLTGAGVAWFERGRCIRSITDVGGQPLGRVYDLATDAAGTTWLALWKQGVLSLDGRRMDTGDVAQWPWKFAPDAAGCLWIAFHYMGRDAFIGCYDAPAEQFAFLNVGHEAERVVQQGTRHVRVDERGWVWMARRGVLCYDGQAWHHFGSPAGGERSVAAASPDIEFSATRLTYEDREGNVWIGLWGGGLIFCDPSSFRYYTKADGLPDGEVRHLGEDAEGRVWIGTMGGMACMEDGHIRPLDQVENVSALVVDKKGQVWSGGDSGRVYRWEGQTPQAIAVAEGAHADEITGLYEDGQGRIWVGTIQSGFGFVEDGRFTRFDGWDVEECRALLQDQSGVFWIGFYSRIPALYWYKDGQFRPASMAEAETIAYVNVLWEHQNTVWVGTAKGLFTFDHSSDQMRHFTADQSGLSANGILALAADRQGHVWVGTSGGGVLRYDGETFQSIRLGPSALGNIVEAVLCDRDGRLWFGTRAGLVAYQPGDTPPGLVIREVIAGALMAAPDAVSCPEDTPEIRIHFQGISFRSGAAQMRYRHRLVGYGPAAAWSAFTFADEVVYRALPLGDYRFEVQTIDRDGLESEVAGLDVEVVPDVQAERLRALAKTQRPTDTDVVQSHSPAMQQVMQQVAQVADTTMNVLVLGETGTGKGVLAHTIHDTSRRDGPFVQVNCGALPAGLIESELFGHEKGAFTGADTRQLGRFELADGGTLFLDEIGTLSLEAQQVLLNILEEHTLTRVGGQQPVRVDVRVVAATNRDLEQAIEEGTFREDLLYRLNGFTLEVPPLRQRPEDIPALVAHLVERSALDFEWSVPTLADGVVAHLQAYSWPGNIRELEHVLHRAVLLCRGGVIGVADLSLRSVASPAGDRDESKTAVPAEQPTEVPPPTEAMDEKQQILAALQSTHWRVSGVHGAAALLGMHPEKLRYRMQKYGLRRPKK